MTAANQIVLEVFGLALVEALALFGFALAFVVQSEGPVQLAYVLAQETAEHEPSPIWPAVNELAWGTVAFLLLVFLMYRTVWPSVDKAFKDRRANIEGKLEQAERDREEAEGLLEQYRRRLRDAEDETQRILEEARANAERVRRDLRSKAETDAGRELDRAR